MSLLFVRADASQSIGAGHVARCFALSEEWQRRSGTVHFCSRQASALWLDRARAASMGESLLPENCSLREDEGLTVALVKSMSPDWVVLDGNSFDLQYQRAIRATGVPLLLIDDQGPRRLVSCDRLLNQNVATISAPYGPEGPGSLFLGPGFALLRSEFRRWRGFKRKVPAFARKVLVTLGGGDSTSLTIATVRLLREASPIKIDVVFGRGVCPDDVKEGFGSDVSMYFGVSNMAELMASADCAVSAAGSTSWELAYMGLPSVLIPLEEDQRRVADNLHERGAAVRAEGISSALIELRRLIADPVRREAMSLVGPKVVDGSGADRVVQSVLEGMK